MGADFKLVGETALAMANVLLPRWMGGKRQGQEWVGERKANGGMGDAWSVNLHTGRWSCFSDPDKRGGDLISLYAAIFHLEQLAAMKAVAEECGIAELQHPAPNLNAVAPEPKAEYPATPIPADAPALPKHFRYGAPSAVYAYGADFWIARYDVSPKKQFGQWTWRNGRWSPKSYPAPRRLYRLERLTELPDGPVIVVEGEKCADAAQALLKRNPFVTWAGGSAAVKSANWTPLTGRDVILWPDNDEPGKKAAAQIAGLLHGKAKRVRVVTPPPDQPEGWDIADAIAQGWDSKQITVFVGANLREVELVKDSEAPVAQAQQPPAPKPKRAVRKAAPPPPAYDPGFDPADDDASYVSWSSMGLDSNQGGVPHPTLANASLILRAHPKFRERVWFDTFQQRIWHTVMGDKREWTDNDTLNVAAYIQQSLKLPKFTANLMGDAVMHAARLNQRNGLTDWLSSLTWDGIERLDTWLADCLGCDLTPYTIAIGRNWPISMVARAFRPGCQVDTMPVLEGKMGRGKSSFLAILGGEWYDSIPTAFGDKDFLQAIQGTWLVEIPDMTGFGKREHSQILATITIRKDRYRASYGRYVEDHLRGCVFAATSENDEYLQDARGRRRFWPIRCTHIDLDALRAQREQIFAEAVHAFRHGATWHEMPGEADEEQMLRTNQDIWTDAVLALADTMWRDTNGKTTQITSTYLLKQAVEVTIGDQSQQEKNRIARIMQEAGWIQSRNATKRYWKRVIRRDETPRASVASEPPEAQAEQPELPPVDSYSEDVERHLFPDVPE